MTNPNVSALRKGLSSEKQALLEKRLRGGAAQSQAPTIPQRKQQQDSALSFAQQRLWLIEQLDPGTSIYNAPVALELEGKLDVAALEKAINKIAERHEVLRTTFKVKDGMPVQHIDTTPLKVSIMELQDAAPGKRREAAEAIAADEALKPFDLGTGPLIRTCLIKLEPDRHILVITMHHIATDGWSAGILLRELSALYGAFKEDKDSPLSELPIQYADFAEWQREWLTPERLEPHLAYWKEKLAGLPPLLELPLDYQRPAAQSYRGASVSASVSQNVKRALDDLSQQEHTTLFMTLLAAFQVLLQRYTGQNDIAVGAPIANRSNMETEGLIGFFVNTLVMRTDLSGHPTFRELVGRVKDVALDAYAHQDAPFEKLVEELQPERSLSHSPFFQVLFALQNTPEVPFHMPGLQTHTVELTTANSKFDLSLVAEASEGLAVSWNYNTDLFKTGTVERMAAHFEVLLKAAAANPDRKITDLPILTEAEETQILVTWTGAERTHHPEARVTTLFESQAEQTPDSIAVSFESHDLSYSELNSRANQLAHWLRGQGIGADSVVGICVERSLEMPTGLLAILKSGAAYMPLDPLYPKDRLATILEGVDLPLILTQEHIASTLPDTESRVLCLDSDWSRITEDNRSNPDSRTDRDNIIGIIQTSGSTGRPKGTMITQRGFLNQCVWYKQLCDITEKTTALLMMTFSFDAAFKNVVVPLISGGKLVLANPGYYDARALMKAAIDHNVTFIMTTPSQLYPLLELDEPSGYEALSNLECLILGGEFALWHRLIPLKETLGDQLRIINMYGPAECSDALTAYEISDERLTDPANMPIGRSLYNASMFVLDREYNLMPAGIPGELCADGIEIVTRGYIGQPDLTAERFVPSPFHHDQRMYRTGDLVKWLEDGNVELIGRIDHQVKIRGQRVELTEVESVVREHSSVHEAIVVAREDVPGNKRLVAYVTAKPGMAVDTKELKRSLREKLPEYMIPYCIVPIEKPPLMPNGKIDRRALPEPDWTKAGDEDTHAAPSTPAEEVLAEIWSEVLNIKDVSINADFFQMGGHSLLATQLMSRVCRAFDISLPLRTLFERRTIAELALAIEETIIHEIAEST